MVSGDRRAADRSARGAALVLLAVVVLGTDARAVHAFCRETVDSAPSGPCVESKGVPRLVWTRSCLSYVFNDHLFERIPMLSEAEIRSIFETSFATWRTVECAGSSDGFFVQQAPGTTSNAIVELLLDERNESVVVARTRDEWLARDHAEGIVALTLLWSNSKTGEILDVDMEINAGSFVFTNCDAKTCGRGMLDLQNTITHEAGHLLGLGHSPIPESTMFDDTTFGQTGKRSLSPDDSAGYCALELPKFACKGTACTCPAPPVFSTRARSSGCAVSGSRASPAPPSAFVLAILTLLTRRRPRARRIPRPSRL